MRVILITGGKSIETIMQQSREDPQQMDLSREDAERVKAYLDAFDGAEMNLTEDGFTLGWAGDTENDNKVRDAIYLMEQDPMFGTYIDDREGFLRVWNEGEYEPDAGIMFDPGEYIPLEETPKQRYLRLKAKYPGAKVFSRIADLSEQDGVYDAEFDEVYAKEYTLANGTYLLRDMAKLYVDDLTQGELEERKEQARKDAWEVVNGLKWEMGIFMDLRTGKKRDIGEIKWQEMR